MLNAAGNAVGNDVGNDVAGKFRGRIVAKVGSGRGLGNLPVGAVFYHLSRNNCGQSGGCLSHNTSGTEQHQNTE